jgi:hypothetical protein
MTSRELTAFVVIGLSMLTPFLFGWLATVPDIVKLRRKVFDNLDNALEDGHFQPPDGTLGMLGGGFGGGHCYGMIAEELAYDLTCYSSDFEGVSTLELLPHVQRWMKQRGL